MFFSHIWKNHALWAAEVVEGNDDLREKALHQIDVLLLSLLGIAAEEIQDCRILATFALFFEVSDGE